MTSFPVGLSRDLPAKRVMRAHVRGQDLVVWRATNGEISVWDNRCPHRGMALSHGFVRGNALACLYHGWHYGTGGVCKYIPAHPELEPPATIRAKPFSVIEQDGVIWVSVDGPAKGMPVPTGLDPLRMLIVAAPADLLLRAAQAVTFDGQTAQRAEDGVLHFGAIAVLLLANPLGATQTQVTALTSAELMPAHRRALSRWCDAVRRHAEAQKEVAA